MQAKQVIVFLFLQAVFDFKTAYMAPTGCGELQQCEPVQAEICRELYGNHSLTAFPTQHFDTQSDARLQFDSFNLLIQNQCSSMLNKFLCGYYFPPCTQSGCGNKNLLGPCQSLCMEVQRDCEPILTAHNLTWNFNCSKLYTSASEQPCIDNTEVSTTNKPATVPPIDMKCQQIEDNPVCSSFHSQYRTYFPNDKFTSQDLAKDHFDSFKPALDSNCSKNLKPFLCTSHYPICVETPTSSGTSTQSIFHCKQICEEVRNSCEPELLKNNFQWPELLNCDSFPDELCLNSTSFLPIEQPTTPEPEVGKCEQIRSDVQEICGVLDKDYTLTHFPHGDFNTQEDAYKEFKSFLPYINCTAEMRAFLCYHFFPSCSPTTDDSLIPCRSVCRKARKGCENCFGDGLTWPAVCENLSVNRNCVTLRDIEQYTSNFKAEVCNM
ncbi:uncharacterized protein [Dysidea avara]|uniref:uncharacterized protein n=1 Tax=Dysidea avara TaxID=196820 RepID=UPI00333350E9